MASIAGDEHTPVLLQQVLEQLAIREDGIYVDCTFGRGGHARAILDRLREGGRLLAIDRDPEAIAAARALERDKRFSVRRSPFSRVEELAQQAGVAGRVHGVLFDLGVSSAQLENPRRGFSFSHDGPLDMRMDPDTGMSAARWLARAVESELAEVLDRYGEERFARRIARAIVAARSLVSLTSTGQLADIIARAHPRWEHRIHPATRSFQAIRIFINRELDELMLALPRALGVLGPGGRLVVISFHSLEDRIVKRFLRDEARAKGQPRMLPQGGAAFRPKLRLLGKAIRAGKAELESNPRARCAVLRAAERLT